MYKFERIDNDRFKIIGNKEFEFTRTVELAKELQSLNEKKTIKLIEYLASRGETLENTKLRVERKEGNKTVVDESNLNAIKDTFETRVVNEIIDNILMKQTGKSFTDVISELGIQIDEARQFGEDLSKALVKGIQEDTPRK